MNEAKLAYEKTSRVEDRSASGVPTVRSVQGVGAQLSAVLVYVGGAQATARAGEDVPGGYRVKSVSVDRVVLTRNGQDLRLGFSAEAPQGASDGPVRLSSPFPGAAAPFQPGR
ncbi:type IV pilus biogenesis protein PilP [Achromobacter xylosoxidans]